MYKEYWALSEMPFENVPNPKFYFPSRRHEEAFSRLLYGIKYNKAAMMVTGEIGCGKTLLSRSLIQKVPKDQFNVVLVESPPSQKVEILQEILSQMTNGSTLSKAPTAKSGWTLRRTLKQRLMDKATKGFHTIIILDEAQVINDREVFEEIRMFLNFQLKDRFLFTLILVGQPELRQKISLIEQLNQRIEVRYHLRPFDYEEMVSYIGSRLKTAGFDKPLEELFPQGSLRLIHKHSGGVPRIVNNLCDLSLLTAFIAKNRMVDLKIVGRVVLDQYSQGY
jgi:general secretion pathway protein A